MKKYITLLVSCITFFIPLLTRAECLRNKYEFEKIGTQSQKQEIEQNLFLKLKERVNPENFKEARDYKGMEHSGV